MYPSHRNISRGKEKEKYYIQTVHNKKKDHSIEDMKTAAEFENLIGPYKGKATLMPRECNKLLFELIEFTMVDNIDKLVLKVLSRYLTMKTYEEIVDERNNEHYCGYPLCNVRDEKKIRYQEMNTVVKKLKLPKYYNSRFCCKQHYLSSEFYKFQLDEEVLFMRDHLDVEFLSPESSESKIVLLDEYLQKGLDDGMAHITSKLREVNIDDEVVEHFGAQLSESVFPAHQS